MPKKVPFLKQEQIERDAEALLAEYECARGVQIDPPVPIEDILEKHLKLRVEFDDMHQLLGVPRSAPGREPHILGAILFNERCIVIDESLDPEEYPAKEGRYRFTLAHEGGHWRLHRNLFTADPAQVSLLDEQAQPAIVCRSSDTKEPIEWQADFYASCLLMPRRLVYAFWLERFGSLHPFIYEWNKANPAFAPRRSSWVKLGDILRPETPDHLIVFNRIAREFAQVFCVSVEPMRIRLENLGLLLRDMPTQRSFAEVDLPLF
jgi:hypothetical protein